MPFVTAMSPICNFLAPCGDDTPGRPRVLLILFLVLPASHRWSDKHFHPERNDGFAEHEAVVQSKDPCNSLPARISRTFSARESLS